MLVGAGHPLEVLALPETDWIITAAVIDRARKLQSERRVEEIDALSRAVGARVAEQLARLFR